MVRRIPELRLSPSGTIEDVSRDRSLHGKMWMKFSVIVYFLREEDWKKTTLAVPSSRRDSPDLREGRKNQINRSHPLWIPK